MKNFKIDFVFIFTAVTLSSVAAYAQLNCKDGAVIRGKEGKKLYCAKITADGVKIRHGEYMSWHENGKLHEVSNYKDDKLDGKFELFHSNGKPYYVVTNYKDGKEDGKFESFYASGKKEEVLNYKDGKRDGKYESFHSNGKLHEVSNYKDGKRDGKFESFYENGKPWEVSNYKDGKLNGKYESFYDNGNRDFIKKYRMDVLLEEVVYEYTDNPCTTLLSITKNDRNDNVVCIDNPTLNLNFPSDKCGPLNEIQVVEKGKVEDTSLKAIPNGTPSGPSNLSHQTPKTPVATPSAPIQ